MEGKKKLSREESLKAFKDKVDKVLILKDMGMLTDEDLEKLKRKLLAEIGED